MCENWSGDGNVCPCALFDIEIVEETDREYVFNGDEADEVWVDRP